MRTFPLLWLLACAPGSTDKADADADGDALSGDEDCDDHDASVGGPRTWTVDEDGDGYGGTTVVACSEPDNAVTTTGDCDDNDASVHPDAAEECDGIDNDCDGTVDEGVDGVWYADTDGDGFGDATLTAGGCEPPSGYVSNASDCDDTNGAVFPDAPELCNGIDDDCDGTIDEEGADAQIWYADADRDGYGDPTDAVASCSDPGGRVLNNEDCDDSTGAVNPAALELCNGIDDDCDGTIDEVDAVDVRTWFYDADGDGWGVDSLTTEACDQPLGYAANGGDCDDTDTAYNPGAAETDCTDPNDYNCDGSVGYADADADGWAACEDCDDTNASANPAATEVCDGADNDCDGSVDEADAIDASTWYADSDTDGYGDAASTTIACDAPSGYVADSTDCDDGDWSINPGATEYCNGADDDCDGDIDEDSAADALTWYADLDGDSFGDPAAATLSCSAPGGFVSDSTDCDDTRDLTHPGATEYCNSIDDDCNGIVDDGATDAKTWWEDADGDGFGNAAIYVTECSQPAGYVRDDDDCDDTNSAVNPGATEVCNSVDDDCDGAIDEDAGSVTWYADDDGDGYGGAMDSGCTAPADAADNDWDCDDTDASIYPGSSSSCPWTSCLDLLDDGIASSSGDYWIDFDGAATETECDMSHDGGGWTLIFEDDMTSPDSGWSITSTYDCGSWGTILGGYGIISGGEIDIDLSTWAITHSEAWIELDYIALDSWDGETMYVEVDSTTIFSQANNNHSTSLSEVCGWNRGYYGSYDSKWPVSEETSHSSSALTLTAGSTLDQGPTDESFGIDNVYVWIR